MTRARRQAQGEKAGAHVEAAGRIPGKRTRIPLRPQEPRSAVEEPTTKSDAEVLIARIEEIDEYLGTTSVEPEAEAQMLQERAALEARLEEVTGVKAAVDAVKKREARDEKARAARATAAVMWDEVKEPEDYIIYEWFFEGYKKGLSDDQIVDRIIQALVQQYEEDLRAADAAQIEQFENETIHWGGRYQPLFDPAGDGPSRVQGMEHHLRMLWKIGADSTSPLVRVRSMVRIWARDADKAEIILLAYLAEYGAFLGGGGRGTRPRTSSGRPDGARGGAPAEGPSVKARGTEPPATGRAGASEPVASQTKAPEPRPRAAQGEPATSRVPERVSADPAKGARARPGTSPRDARSEELARDPAHGGRVESKGLREAKIGLDLEASGKLKAPIRRDPSGAAEFIDGDRQPWDIKAFNSKARQGKGGYNLPDSLDHLSRQFRAGENVIIDTTNMAPEHVTELRIAVEERGWNARILWFP